VLDGALAFALPTKFGQSLIVSENENQVINWKSYDFDSSCWFETDIAFYEIINYSGGASESIKNTLIKILHEAHKLNSDVLLNLKGAAVITNLTFPRQWGLGTSSTLINNIAQWFLVDAFVLLQNSFGGSGYDVACAQNKTPILYQIQNNIPVITPLLFNPEFTKNCYFVYLNQKQNSKTAIDNYRKKARNDARIINQISNYSSIISSTTDVTIFENTLQLHENAISLMLKQPTIKQLLFPDFDGTIKSLGAWGGDFIMVLSPVNPKSYFEQKGYSTVISFSEMIL
jgi:mevalonate kinase